MSGIFKPNINSFFIISILKGFIAKHMDQRNISVVSEIIVKLMLLKTFCETENNPNLSRIYLIAHF